MTALAPRLLALLTISLIAISRPSASLLSYVSLRPPIADDVGDAGEKITDDIGAQNDLSRYDAQILFNFFSLNGIGGRDNHSYVPLVAHHNRWKHPIPLYYIASMTSPMNLSAVQPMPNEYRTATTARCRQNTPIRE